MIIWKQIADDRPEHEKVEEAQHDAYLAAAELAHERPLWITDVQDGV